MTTPQDQGETSQAAEPAALDTDATVEASGAAPLSTFHQAPPPQSSPLAPPGANLDTATEATVDAPIVAVEVVTVEVVDVEIAPAPDAAPPEPAEPLPADVAPLPPPFSHGTDLDPDDSAARALDRRRLRLTAPTITLSALVTGVFLMFLLIEPSPRWVVLVSTAISALALDGVLRAGRRESFAECRLDTTPYLLVPTLYVLAMPVFIEYNSQGYWTVLAAIGGGVGYGTLVVGTLSSVREHDPGRDAGRFIVTAATYVLGFAMFSLVFLFGVGQTPAALAVGLAATVLAAEILREGEIDPGETLLYSVVTGVAVGEARWLVHYLPLHGYAAALTLLLAFYLVTGLLHSHVVRQLTSRVAAEYASVATAGVAFIVGLRLAGLA
ncbi:MAG: hypothetical protein EXR66_08360 [Dehalococcoidia bacterium]|nr:hypothetical protein [Dehalococcoidia bacterium]